MIHKGDLIIKKGDNTDYSQLTTVGGNLFIYSNAKLDNLTTVGGGLYIYPNVKLEADNLTTVGGYLYIYSNTKLDNLTEVGGDLFIYSNAKLDNLTTVGGGLSIYSNAKLEANFLKNHKWKSVDTNLFIIESTKPKGDIIIYKGYNVIGVKNNVIQREDCYVAESGKFYAHGKSMKKAVEDLHFKLISKKLKNEPINKDTVIDIKYYRLVTGACEFGVKSFIKSNGLKESYKACELLPILESNHAYGVEKFKSLLTF